MTRQRTTANETLQIWRKAALRYPEAQEGTSCDRSAFKARDKAFLFMGAEDHSCNAMVKLRESLEEAARLATREPDHYKVGSTGWVTVTFEHGESPPPGLLEGWIDESYRALAHKQLVAMLPERGLPAGAKASTKASASARTKTSASARTKTSASARTKTSASAKTSARTKTSASAKTSARTKTSAKASASR